MKVFLIAALVLITVVPVTAQDTALPAFTLPLLVPITRENAGQIRQIAQIGRSFEIFALASQGDLTALATTEGAMLYREGERNGTLLSTPAVLNSIALTEDASRVAAGDVNGVLWVWDAESGDLLARLMGHVGAILDVTFGSDGELIASAGADNLARLWDVATGESYGRLMHSAAVTALAFSPDGVSLATGGADGGIRVWDVQSKQATMVMFHDLAVTDLAFTPDGITLISSSRDGDVRLWNAERGHVQAIFRYTKYDHAYPTHFDLNADGTRIAAMGSNRIVYVWDILYGDEEITGALINQFDSLGTHVITDSGRAPYSVTWQGFRYDPVGVAFDAGDEALTIADSYVFARWHYAEGDTAEYRMNYPVPVRAVSLNDTHLAAAYGDQVICWDLSTGEPFTSALSSVNLQHVDFSANPRLLADIACDGANDTTLRWITATSDAQQYQPVSALTINGAGTLVGFRDDTEVKLLRVDTGTVFNTFPGGAGSTYTWHQAADVAISPDSAVIAGADDEGLLTLWDVTGGLVFDTADSIYAGRVMAFNAASTMIAAGYWQGWIGVWDFAAGEEMLLQNGQPYDAEGFHGAYPVSDLAFNTDGSLLAAVEGLYGDYGAAGDYALRLWDVQTGEEVAALFGHDNSIWRVVFSPDGRLIATASTDGTVRLWGAAG